MHLIKGAIFSDYRGIIRHVNDFGFESIKRFYTIYHPDTKIIRAWQGHKLESKYFYVVKGSFLVNTIKIDKWEGPDKNILPNTLRITENESNIIIVEPGQANGFKALTPDSIMMVFSDKTLEESQADNYRWEAGYFLNVKWD